MSARASCRWCAWVPHIGPASGAACLTLLFALGGCDARPASQSRWWAGRYEEVDSGQPSRMHIQDMLETWVGAHGQDLMDAWGEPNKAHLNRLAGLASAVVAEVIHGVTLPNAVHEALGDTPAVPCISPGRCQAYLTEGVGTFGLLCGESRDTTAPQHPHLRGQGVVALVLPDGGKDIHQPVVSTDRTAAPDGKAIVHHVQDAA